ncbi:MAG: hypothetical protein OXH15_10610 [Gammaproteobacteria bacterium]|nr:hypothetical protein [Gammaproteobacteria bacterium]
MANETANRIRHLTEELKRHRTELTSIAVRGTNLVLRTMILGGQDQGSVLFVVSFWGINIREYTLNTQGKLYRGVGSGKSELEDFSSENIGRRKILRAVRYIVKDNTSRWERFLLYLRFRKLIGLSEASAVGKAAAMFL